MEYLNELNASREGINSEYEQASSALRRRFVEEMRNYSMENLIKDKQDAASAREKAAFNKDAFAFPMPGKAASSSNDA